MRGTKFDAFDHLSPARVSGGDRGGIWKCYNLEHQPIGYLVATGNDCVSPVAYIGLLPNLPWRGSERHATIRNARMDAAALFREAVSIAVDFCKAVHPYVDLSGVSCKDIDTVPAFLFHMILKPTNGTYRAARYYHMGASYRPFREKPQQPMGVALFHACCEEGLPPHDADWQIPAGKNLATVATTAAAPSHFEVEALESVTSS